MHYPFAVARYVNDGRQRRTQKRVTKEGREWKHELHPRRRPPYLGELCLLTYLSPCNDTTREGIDQTKFENREEITMRGGFELTT
jgi:hypothetical protein